MYLSPLALQSRPVMYPIPAKAEEKGGPEEAAHLNPNPHGGFRGRG